MSAPPLWGRTEGMLLRAVEQAVLSKPMLAALGCLARAPLQCSQLSALSVACTHASAILSCCDRGYARALSRFLHTARDALGTCSSLRCTRNAQLPCGRNPAAPAPLLMRLALSGRKAVERACRQVAERGGAAAA